MIYRSPDPVASGQRYRVADVLGVAPTKLADFVGAGVAFSIECADKVHLIAGCGRMTEDGTVRLMEKDGATSKDVRTWVIEEDAESFTAATQTG